MGGALIKWLCPAAGPEPAAEYRCPVSELPSSRPAENGRELPGARELSGARASRPGGGPRGPANPRLGQDLTERPAADKPELAVIERGSAAPKARELPAPARGVGDDEAPGEEKGSSRPVGGAPGPRSRTGPGSALEPGEPGDLGFRDAELRDAGRDPRDFSFSGTSLVVKVVDVYDGDTIRVKFRMFSRHIAQWKARLLGCDAPELRSPKSNPGREAEKKAALASRDYLADMLGGRFERRGGKKEVFEGGRLFAATLGGFDKYGRVLITLYGDDGASLNQRMIDSGHAYAYDGGTKRLTGA